MDMKEHIEDLMKTKVYLPAVIANLHDDDVLVFAHAVDLEVYSSIHN